MENNMGGISIKPSSWTAARPGTFEFTYAAGEKKIPAGGSIRFLLPNNWNFPQVQDPKAEAYSSVRLPAGVKAEVTASYNSVYVKLIAGELMPGDRVTLVYGDRAQGSPGARPVPTATRNAPEAGTFHLAVSFAKDGEYVFIDPPARVELTIGDATWFHVTVPSLAATGREVEARIVAVDDFANADENYTGEAAIDGRTIGFEKADKGRKLLRFKARKPEVLVLRIESNDRKLKGMSNPLEVTARPPKLNLYWGDIHVHSQLSDALGTPEGAYVYARETAGLDLAAVIDHDWVYNDLKRYPSHAMNEEGWEKLKQVNDEYYRPGEFVTLLGYEWIRREKPGSSFGHMNIYYRDNKGAFLVPGKSNSDNPRLFADRLEEMKDVILAPHQTLYCSPDLLLAPINCSKMRLVEIYSGWGNSEMVDGRLMNDFVRGNIMKRERKGESVQQYLAHGYRLGFIGSSDDHFTTPGRMPKERFTYSQPTPYRGGLAAIYAKELTREAVYDALWNRQVYAVTGARIILEFYVNDRFMGQEIKDDGSGRKIRAKVIGTGPIEKVELVKNNRVVKSWEQPGDRGEFEFTDGKPEQPVDYYYLRVTQADGEMAWSSPVWVERT